MARITSDRAAVLTSPIGGRERRGRGSGWRSWCGRSGGSRSCTPRCGAARRRRAGQNTRASRGGDRAHGEAESRWCLGLSCSVSRRNALRRETEQLTATHHVPTCTSRRHAPHSQHQFCSRAPPGAPVRHRRLGCSNRRRPRRSTKSWPPWMAAAAAAAMVCEGLDVIEVAVDGMCRCMPMGTREASGTNCGNYLCRPRGKGTARAAPTGITHRTTNSLRRLAQTTAPPASRIRKTARRLTCPPMHPCERMLLGETRTGDRVLHGCCTMTVL